MAEYIIDVLADGIEQGSINTSGNTPDSRMVRSAGYLEFLGDDDGIITVSATATTGRTIMVSFLGYASNTTNNPLFAWYWYGLPHNFDVSAYPNVKYFRLVLIYEGYSTLTPEEVASCTIEYSYTVPWYMDGEQPTPTAALPILQEHFTKPYPATLWRIDESNGGLPYTELMPDILYVEPPNLWILPQRPLIHVYSDKTTNFNTNGYAIIEPISCEVYHEENGEYSAQFETYCDEYGKFTYLHKQAQVKIPIRYHGEISWQIFRVMNTHRIMNADGTYRIRALAYHKFYDNNNFLIKSAHPTGMSGITALPYICTHSLYNSQIYPFEASSDIAAGKTAYYDNMSITNALLGADQCFVNRWGGKLYRDNLHFSINGEMEHSKSAGVISYAYNLTDIDFEEDDTELITDLIAEDNFGNSYHVGVPDSDLRVPNRIYAYRSFYYDEEDVQAFHADAAAYLDEYKQSVVNITVNFLNLSELDKYKEFQQLDAYEVGDRVIIYHKDLDIYYSHLEIISKRYDVVKRRTVEIQIGDFKNAITQRAYMSDTTSDGQTAQDKMNAQLFAQDTKIMSVSISGMETFDIFALEKRTINELEGR